MALIQGQQIQMKIFPVEKRITKDLAERRIWVSFSCLAVTMPESFTRSPQFSKVAVWRQRRAENHPFHTVNMREREGTHFPGFSERQELHKPSPSQLRGWPQALCLDPRPLAQGRRPQASGLRVQVPWAESANSRLQAANPRSKVPGLKLQALGLRPELQVLGPRLEVPGLKPQAPGPRPQTPGLRSQDLGSRSRPQVPGPRSQDLDSRLKL